MDQGQEETIAFLERAESYGPGVTSVERIDTHASVLFLAGTRAFKLKRAVRFSPVVLATVAIFANAVRALSGWPIAR